MATSTNSSDRKGVLAISALAAFVGSLCCVTPVVLVLLGLASISVAADMGNVLYGEYRWIFRIVALGFLAAALILYFRRKGICTLDQARRQRNRILNVSLVVLFFSIGAYLAFNYIAVHYWGIAVGLPWAQWNENWAIPASAIVLSAGAILFFLLVRNPRPTQNDPVDQLSPASSRSKPTH